MAFKWNKDNLDKIQLGFTFLICCALTVSFVSASSVYVQPSPVATVTEGAVLWLTCTYDLEEGTLGQLQWKDKNGDDVATATPTAKPPCSAPSENYSVDCNNLASNEVRLGLLSSVHGDTYSCSVYLSDFTLIGNVSTQVSVVVPVPSVTFTPPVSDTVTVTPGGSQTYTCVTGSCRPSARIDWYKDGVNVTTQAGSVSSDGDKFVTTSSLTLIGARGDSPATVQCRASNVDRMTAVQSGVKHFVVEYKPVVTLTPTHLTVVEGQTAQIACEAVGNPTPTLQWRRGGLTVHTGPGTSLTLTMAVIDRSATDNYTCRAEGMSTVPGRQLVTERSVYLLVQYPPEVAVNIPLAVEEGNTNVRLRCQTTGEPNTLTSQSWTQTIDQSFITDQFTYETATQDTIVLAEAGLDDTGTYTCSVSNGIPDRQGQTIQSNSSVLNVKVGPKFNASGQNHNFYSKLNGPVTVKIPFYSNPSVMSTVDLEWTQLTTGDQVIASINTVFQLFNGEAIDLSVKGRTVTFSGQAAVMNLSSFDQSMTGNYTITVYNDGRRRQSTTTFSITPSGPPEKPTDFQETDTTTTSITVEWTKGFNGGHSQTFVILYGPEGGALTQTLSVKEQQQSTYTKEITDLRPNTRYQLNLYAYNDAGNSSFSANFIISNTQEANVPGTDIAAIAGGVGGSVLVLLIITAVGIVFYRQRNTGGGKGTSQSSDGALFNPDHNEEEDGLKRNILYESAGPYRPERQHDADDKNGHAVVGSRKNLAGAEYAEVIPKKNRKGKTEKSAENGDIYAQIQKNGKEKKEQGKEKKELGKEKKKIEKGKKKPKKNTNEGQIETVYEIVGAVGGDKTKPVEDQMPCRKKNQEGLVYLDVEFQEQENGIRQAVIHGIENRNDYALVDFTKQAEPLPEEDCVNDVSAKKSKDGK